MLMRFIGEARGRAAEYWGESYRVRRHFSISFSPFAFFRILFMLSCALSL